MTNDSVREELVGKVSAAKSLSAEAKNNAMPKNALESFKTAASQKTVAAPKSATSEIGAKSTSPTLVEFHSRNATLPEWRLQLQNAVRQRQQLERLEIMGNEPENSPLAPRAQLVTSGANALKAETSEEPQLILHDNPDVARALQRIQNSRKKFLVEEDSPSAPLASALKTNKNYPFYIAAKTNDEVVKPAEVNSSVNSFAKPKLAAPLKIEKIKLDTNKLPPLSQAAQISTSFAKPPAVIDKAETKIESRLNNTIAVEKETLKADSVITQSAEATETVKTIEREEPETEEYDDCPTFAMRFNAGLFDLIIGSFVSSILLAPFMLFGGNWLSWAGFFAFAAVCAVVMFVYLTTSVGLYGKTFGMRLFSLEVVDIEGENYPTFHQAAVSSSVYLLSLAFGGIGFLTLLFNEDKRAAHDIVSGTLVVKED